MRTLTAIVIAAALMASVAGAWWSPLATAKGEEGPDDEREESTDGENEFDDFDDAADADEDNEDDENDEDDEDDEANEWERERRELRLDSDDTGFRFESRRDSGLGRDEMRVEFNVDDSRFRFRFESDAGGNRTEIAMELVFEQVVEFVDTNGNGRFDVTDEVVRRMPLDDMDGAGVTTTPTASGARIVTARYPLPDGGTLALRFIATPVMTTIDGVLVRPTETKFDIAFTDYAFQRPGSSVGLTTRIESSLEVEGGISEGLRGVAAKSGDLEGFYRWVSNATVDGEPVAVGVTVLSSESETEENEAKHEVVVVFAYPAGASIVHDPSVGVARVAAAVTDVATQFLRGDVRLYASGVILAAVLVLLPAYARVRGRR